MSPRISISPNPSGSSQPYHTSLISSWHTFHLFLDTLSSLAFQDTTHWWSSSCLLSHSSTVSSVGFLSLLSSTSLWGLASAQSLVCFPFHVQSLGDLIQHHCFKRHLSADDSQSSISSSDLSPDLHISKSTFHLNSYTSMSNNHVELNLPQI